MKTVLCWAFLFGCLAAQTNFSLYFPLSSDYSRSYESAEYPLPNVESVFDTSVVSGHTYYGLAPHNNFIEVFWLRATPDTVFILEPTDSSEAVLYNFKADMNMPWEIPPSGGPIAINECFWGNNMWLISVGDSVVCNNRTIYNCYKFGHSSPCFDAGLLSTIYARDFGKVAFSEVTEGGVLDWTMVLPPQDTIDVTGTYTIVGNPCLTIPCLPGVVSAVQVGDSTFILTHRDNFYAGDFDWQGFVPLTGDSIHVQGVLTQRTDLLHDPYATVELIDAAPLVTSAAHTSDGSLPGQFELEQNYPNPFNPTTRIAYHLAEPGMVELVVFSSSGRVVRSLINAVQSVGDHSVDFDGSGLSSGNYYYQLKINGLVQCKKMILLQ